MSAIKHTLLNITFGVNDQDSEKIVAPSQIPLVWCNAFTYLLHAVKWFGKNFIVYLGSISHLFPPSGLAQIQG